MTRPRFWIAASIFLALGVGAAGAQDLNKLIAELLEKNPAIRAARLGVDSRRALVTAARTLPDPTVSFETMGNLLPPTLQAGDPSSARVLRFSQEIPFPGKLDLQGQIASVDADSEMWRYEQARRDAIAELKMAYYDLFLAQRLTEVLGKSRELLQQFVDISEAQYRVGKGTQQDLLKARVESTRLLDRLAVLERERDTAQTRINILLRRPPDSVLERLPEIPVPKLDYTLDQLYLKALENDPLVCIGRREIHKGELGVSIAKKSAYPDFEIGFFYFNRRDLPEMYGIMAKAAIPLYFWRKQRPGLESATAGLLQQRHQYENTLSTLYLRLKDPFLRAKTDTHLLELYSGAIVPQANLALESAITGYRVGKVDFLTLLSSQNTVLEYEMKYHEALADCCKALAAIEAVVGEVLMP